MSEKRRGQTRARDRRIDRGIGVGVRFGNLRHRQYARRHPHYSLRPFFAENGWVVKLQIADWKFLRQRSSRSREHLRKAYFSPSSGILTPLARLITPATERGCLPATHLVRAYTYNRNFPNKSLSSRVTSAIAASNPSGLCPVGDFSGRRQSASTVEQIARFFLPSFPRRLNNSCTGYASL